MSRWRSQATAATNCSPATTAISSPAGSGAAYPCCPARSAPGSADAIGGISAERWSSLLGFLPSRLQPPQIGDKLHKLATVLSLADGDAMYRKLVSHWEPAEVMPNAAELKGVLWDPTLANDLPGLMERMQFLDLVTYLPDDILTKVDRASMAVALEARVPLLDHRVVEFAWRLPRSAKFRGGTSKWLLRQVLYRHVPRKLDRAPQDGVWGSARRVAARSAARLGRNVARRKAPARGGFLRCLPGAPALVRALERVAQLATPALGRADVRGVA